MSINRSQARQYLQAFDFKNLFIEVMGWGTVPQSRTEPLEVNGRSYLRRHIAHMSGVNVFELFPASPQTPFPDKKTRAAIHKQIAHLSHENLIIFLDNDQKRTQSLWYWVKREAGKPQPREHLYLQGQPGDLFLSKIDAMSIDLNDLRADGTLPITDVTRRLADSLDVERVTKKFYNEFSQLRLQFIDLIEGIDRESDRFWYASVLINRLMFIYFLQKRGFIQNNTRYLDQKLEASQQQGPDRYYSDFLQALFFEGFAKPADMRSAEANKLLGEIKYLNGGLFIRHRLELTYPNIHIPDQAFANLLTLFGHYSWHLDDTPGAEDNAINPDVLGYIFEKYINQKAFGAYYTRAEITQYLCERTIHAVILDRIHEHTPQRFSSLEELLLKLDAQHCRLLLKKILPELSILDPACGSGAFLVAAMKTLLNIYAAAYGKIRFLNDTTLTEDLRKIDKQHPSLNYYIRKQIITDNLYGVDIMEEAAEIAKLRLFLVLVSAAQKVSDLEPLPNIDFNIMAGNSLIGLLKVDDTRFEQAQMSLLQGAKAAHYRHLLAEKNQFISSYRNTATFSDDLQALRENIDAHKAQAYASLNNILFDDFGELGIRFEQAQASGKAQKRPLVISDIERLTPFHWGYEFDEIMETRGGFDVVIANPPWETFKPQAKEFFAQYSELVTKNKMTIKEFEKQQGKMLSDPEVQVAWLAYQSSFPYVSAYYRSAEQFKNQISIVNGKKAGTDINLYKLFTEQCFNLLRPEGQCGLVIPSGIYTDLGTKQLRQMLFEQTTITGLMGFENRKTIFEGVDSRFKFVVLTLKKEGQTTQFPAAFMRHDVAELDQFPSDDSLQMQATTIRKLSPDSLSIPEFKSNLDLQIAEKMAQFPLLGETIPDSWNLKLGTEFHMTNDSDLFHTEPAPGRLPLYEGKMIHQFTHQWGNTAARYWVDEQNGRQRILGKKAQDTGQLLDYQTYRLAHRSIGRNTDSRTFICCLLPQNVFCGHSLNTSVNLEHPISLLYLTTILNSFVCDFALRQSVTANLTMFFIYQISIPRLQKGDRYFDAIVERAAKLICTTPEFDALAQEVGLGTHHAGITNEAERAHLRAELDAIIAHIYGLTEEEFTYILTTFPLVPEATKQATLQAYRSLSST